MNLLSEEERSDKSEKSLQAVEISSFIQKDISQERKNISSWLNAKCRNIDDDSDYSALYKSYFADDIRNDIYAEDDIDLSENIVPTKRIILNNCPHNIIFGLNEDIMPYVDYITTDVHNEITESTNIGTKRRMIQPMLRVSISPTTNRSNANYLYKRLKEWFDNVVFIIPKLDRNGSALCNDEKM